MPSKQETSPPLSEAQKTRKKHSTASPKHRGRSPSQDTARALKNTTTPQPQHQGYPPLKGGEVTARGEEKKKKHQPTTDQEQHGTSELSRASTPRFGLDFQHLMGCYLLTSTQILAQILGQQFQ